MEKYFRFLLFWGLMAVSVSEKLVKIEGTSGKFSDIVIDSKGRWYIVQDEKLCSSLDKGVTCKMIDIPSNVAVLPNLGIDQIDNIYVQDEKFNMFRVFPTVNDTFIFDNIVLNYDNERLVSRPFVLGENTVYFASKSGLMSLENSTMYADRIESPPHSRTAITQWVSSNMTNRFGYEYDTTFFSGGGPRYWIYVKMGLFINPVTQMKSMVTHMNAIIDRIYCFIDGEKEVNVVIYVDTRMFFMNQKKYPYVTTIKGLDASKMNIENEFIIYLPQNNYKTYLYGNIGNSGVVYELTNKGDNLKYTAKAENEQKLDNVRILCGTIEGNKLYFGTSDGVYEMIDIKPKTEEEFVTDKPQPINF